MYQLFHQFSELIGEGEAVEALLHAAAVIESHLAAQGLVGSPALSPPPVDFFPNLLTTSEHMCYK